MNILAVADEDLVWLLEGRRLAGGMEHRPGVYDTQVSFPTRRPTKLHCSRPKHEEIIHGLYKTSRLDSNSSRR